MANKITHRDREAISAYLDNELKPRERARIKTRLDAEPQLKGALDEMQRTRTLLRSLPQVRAPRNFTLSPEMAPRRAFTFPVFPTLQFASVLAAILLVVFVAGDWSGILIDRPIFTLAQTQSAPEALMLEAAEPVAEDALPTEALMAAEPMIQKSVGEETAEGEAALGMGAEESGETQSLAEQPFERMADSPPSESLQASEIASTLAPGEPALQLDAPMPTETPDLAPTETLAEPIPVPGLRFIEMLLAVIVVFTVLVTLALRRRMFG